MKKFFSKENFTALGVAAVSLYINLPATLNGFFAFTYDQGRDLLQVAGMVYGGKLTLIGPTTGLPGIFYGPWWYYFLAPIMFIAKGDPQIIADFFVFFGALTIMAAFLLIKKVTNNFFLAAALSLTAVISNHWMFAPTIIWNTSMVPILLIIFLFVLQKIIDTKRLSYFFLIGILMFLILDFELPFGLILILSFIVWIPFQGKIFGVRGIVLTVIGALTVLAPRVFFDLRHKFLMSHAVINYTLHPKAYHDVVPVYLKFIQMLDLFWGIFAQRFAKGSKPLATAILLVLVFMISILIKDKKTRQKIIGDNLLKFLATVVIVGIISFSLYPDVVWDYYLIGFPLIFLLLMAKIFYYTLKNRSLSFITKVLLILLVVINFNKNLVSPFKISWQGDGATYRNQKRVMDDLKSSLKGDYSIYFYTPARFDYPFDYLVSWYARKGLIEAPKENQERMFLVIRDDKSHSYIWFGWYGDKTQNKSKLLEKRRYQGDIIVEKHLR